MYISSYNPGIGTGMPVPYIIPGYLEKIK